MEIIFSIPNRIFSLIKRSRLLFWPIVLLFFSLVTFIILFLQRQPDLYDHVIYALNHINGKPHVGNFLYYVTIAAMAFWSPDIDWLIVNGVIILTSSVMFKYKLSYDFLKNNSQVQKSSWVTLAFVTFSLCLAMNFPNRLSFTWLIGQFSPNLWHNSTVIFLMPFALFVFKDSLIFLNEGNKKSAILRMALLVPISMLVKPSFFFVFGPAFGIMCIKTFRLRKEFWLGIIPILTGTGLLVFQILQIYFFYPYHKEAGFRIDPFFVWSNWSYFIPASILVSVLFPLVFTIAFWNKVKNIIALQFTWLMLIFGIILYAAMAENGPFWIQVANNFGWQLYVADFLLFLVCLSLLIKIKPDFTNLSKREAFVWLVFFLHFVIGILYLIKMPIFGYR